MSQQKAQQPSKHLNNTSGNSKSEQHDRAFPVLTISPDRTSNVVKFKERAYEHISKELGSISRVIISGRRYTPPEIPVPPANAFNTANDPSGAKKTAYSRSIENRVDEINDLKKKETQLFFYIWPRQSIIYIIQFLCSLSHL
jgi:hypothetical protein